jgi:hypothetical protein
MENKNSLTGWRNHPMVMIRIQAILAMMLKDMLSMHRAEWKDEMKNKKILDETSDVGSEGCNRSIGPDNESYTL